MGCPISKDGPIEGELPGSLNTMANSKAQLEWKLCRAKETPEPDFDLSECVLTQIPSGIFVLCKVLRKEILNLSHNKIVELHSGGSIGDLVLLRVLDLNFNHIKRLPDDVSNMENLRELLISNNQIEKLPTTINKLTHLEHLDVSHNSLKQISEVNCMPNLRILNISGNTQLNVLPYQLGTCDSLADLVFDVEYIEYPPSHVMNQNTSDILNYLLTSEGYEPKDRHIDDGLSSIIKSKKDIKHDINTDFIKQEQGRAGRGGRDERIDAEKRVRDFIDQEMKANELLELKLHEEQQRRKQELMELLRKQQVDNDSAAQRFQDDSESKRTKLINHIFEEEANIIKSVNAWLSIKNQLDPVLFEKERIEQEQLLSQLQLEQTELRKQEIIANMAEMLQGELNQVQDYNKQRDIASKKVLEQDAVTYSLLQEVVRNKDMENTSAVASVLENEKLQQAAVAALVAKNDSRSWGLVEQVRIIESQLASVTQNEISLKKLSADEYLNDVCAERVKLTVILVDLLEQQVARKQELMNTILSLKIEQEDRQQDFWLLQYQKLIDSQPKELSAVNIDPALGYNLLMNGVVQYIPLLAELFQRHQHNLSAITDDDLLRVGIRNDKDREEIQNAIRDFEHQQQKLAAIPLPTVQNIEQNTNLPQSNTVANENDEDIVMKNECVICMEKECQIVFIPCGHLCSCIDCQKELKLCPMCRGEIDRRIKILPA